MTVGCRLTALLIQPHRSRPKSERGQRLVGPSEITPNDIEIDEHHAENAEEERQGDYQSLRYRSLVPFEEIGHNQSCRPQSRIAAGDRCGNNTDDSQQTTDSAQPRTAHPVNHQRRYVLAGILCCKSLQSVYAVQPGFRVGEERARCGCPYERQYALSHHRAVEDPSSLAFAGHATRHDRALGAVESGDSAAGDADEHHREKRQTVGLSVMQAIEHFGHFAAVPSEHNDHDTNTHKQQYGAENRVESAYQLVYRQDRCQRVVTEDDQHPNDGYC